MSDTRAPDAAGPNWWLELQEDAVEWIAAERDDWWHRGDTDGKPRLNLLRISADTGLDDAQIYRFHAAAKSGDRVAYKSDTIAALVDVGATERRVSEAQAFHRIFRVCRASRRQAVAA